MQNPTADHQHAPIIELTAADLPASGAVACPSPRTGMPAWASHPRVYLCPDSSGQAQCPYCGMVYKLKAGAGVTQSH